MMSRRLWLGMSKCAILPPVAKCLGHHESYEPQAPSARSPMRPRPLDGIERGTARRPPVAAPGCRRSPMRRRRLAPQPFPQRYERTGRMSRYEHYRTIAAERRGRLLVLTLNRPDALNVVNAELHTEL